MWSWEYAYSILPDLCRALGVTVAAALSGFVIACLIGLFLAVLRMSRWSLLSGVVGIFVESVRNTPLLVQLFFLYYGLPMLTGLSFSSFMVGVAGLGLHYSAYLSEVYRSGIQSVPRGQWEAAWALNFTRWQTWTKVILPQAIPPIIPVMGNYLLVMFKETPVLSAITLIELLATAKNIVSVKWRVFEPFTLVGVLFLAISLISSVLIRRLETRLNGQRGR